MLRGGHARRLNQTRGTRVATFQFPITAAVTLWHSNLPGSVRPCPKVPYIVVPRHTRMGGVVEVGRDNRAVSLPLSTMLLTLERVFSSLTLRLSCVVLHFS